MQSSVEQPVTECILDDGTWHCQGYDENGLCRSLNGRLTGVHKVLCWRNRVHRTISLFGSDGGFMIPVHSKLGHEMRMHFERLVSWYGRKQFRPVNIENNIFNFYLSNAVQSREINIGHNSQQLGNEYGRAVRS